MDETAGKPLAQRFWEEYDDGTPWEDLRAAWQEKVEAALQAVSAGLRESGKPAKVIVVTETSGRERRHHGDSFMPGLFGLSVKSGDRQVAHYQLGTYQNVFEEDAASAADAETASLQHRLGNVSADLGTALKALRGIRDEPQGHGCPARYSARVALAAIGYDDTEADQ